MFCGKLLILSSEEEAVEHMSACPALQAQFSGESPFTLPPEVMEKLGHPDHSDIGQDEHKSDLKKSES